MGVKADILFADDDKVLRDAIRLVLKGDGYSVRTARNGEEALALFAARRPDLLLLDVMMPRLGGIQVLERIRETDPLVPVLFFTAMPSDAGLVRALGLGADDYIDKARPPEELLARISAALRREAAHAAAEGAHVLRMGRLEIDLARMTARGGGIELQLTRYDAIILGLLASKRGKAFSYDEMVAALHGTGCATESAVYSAMYRLKAKLGPAGALLECKRGVGYRLLA